MAVVVWGSRARRPGAWGWHRLAGLLLGLCWPLLGHAVAYQFPGLMPAGCSGSAGSYSCGAVTLAAGDTVAIGAVPTTISFNSLSANNAKINSSGSASDLTLNISGQLSASAGAVIMANVNAGSVNSSGAVTYGGSIATTTGAVTLGAGTTVAGNLSTTTGAITLLGGTASVYTTVGSITSGGTVTLNAYNGVSGDLVGYLVSSAGHNNYGGSITSTTTYVSLGGYATVAGDIYAQTYVDTGHDSSVGGSITSATSYIDTGHTTSVGGSLASLGTYVDIHDGSTVGGSVKTASYFSMTHNSSVGGNITSQTTIYMASGSSVGKCVRSLGSNTITIPSANAVGGACCGAGSTCGNSCVSSNPKPPACAWPDSGLFAEYLFEENSYNGTRGEVKDTSGSKRHGTMLGGVASTASGRICRGMDVPRNTSATVQAFDTGLDVNSIGNTGTISFWYKSVTTGVEHRMLYDATESASGKFYLYRDDMGSGVDLNAHLTDGGGTVRNVDKLNTVTDEQWAHIVVTWLFKTGTGASHMRLYVNGALQDEQPYTVSSGKIADAIGRLVFGDNRSSASPELNSAYGTIDQVRIYDAELTASEVSTLYNEANTCTGNSLHHVEVKMNSASGVTCKAEDVTIKACADAACSVTYTGGLNGTVTFSGGPTVTGTKTFTIASGSDTAVLSVQVTTPGSVTLGLSGLSVTPSDRTAPYCGLGAAASAGGSCVFTSADSGFIFNVPDHVAGDTQSVTVSAVRKSDNSLMCTPAFASVSKSIQFSCAYSNPSSGFVPVRVAGAALNAANDAAAACDGTGRSVSLSFDATGVATTTVDYADAGQMNLSASYSSNSGSDAGLTMTGSDTFIAAPAGFSISGVTPGPIKAGANFAATVTAINRGNAATPNFGRESIPATPTMSFTKRQPSGGGSQDGTFSGSLGTFSSGVAQASALSWTEVGNGDLSVTWGSHLGSGIGVSGTTGNGAVGAVGPFIPSYFTVEATQACNAGSSSFTYSGQPFTMTVTAYNLAGGVTRNYDGTGNMSANFAKTTDLSAVTNGGLGGLAVTSLAPGAFTTGVATFNTQSFTYTNKLTAPASVVVRAVDSDGVTSENKTEQGPNLRSGRLQISNAFGSAKSSLNVPVTTQYWSGKAWVVNDADTGCTVLPAASVVRSGYLDSKGAPTSAWTTSASGDVTLSNGRSNIVLTAPTNGGSGSVDLSVNLGATTSDQSCLSAHPSSTGAQKPWLRSLNGNCTTTYDRDPSARATFGVFSPETQRLIHTRDLF